MSEERQRQLERARLESRRQYLSKREADVAALRAKQFKAEEELFSFAGEDLSPEEVERMQRERDLFAEAAKRREKRAQPEGADLYQLPDVAEDSAAARLKRAKESAQSFIPTSGSAKEVTDQQRVEQQQLRAAGVKLPSTEDDQLQLILDNQIQFVTDEVQEQVLAELLSDTPKPQSLKDRQAQSLLAKRESLKHDRQALPIFNHRSALLEAVEKFPLLVLVGETGSGKTTQLPQYLVEGGFSRGGKMKIGCTQPRRVAAMSVATRVADEMGVKLGSEVGYSIRFEDNTSESTVIKYMTDGMLLREFLSDPALESYSVMIIDEAHERTLHTDVLFALVKDLLNARDDFRVIISSATIDAEKFSEFFGNAPIFNVPGRRFPVAIHYASKPEANYLEAAVITALQVHVTQPLEGDILVFLTGQEDIEEAAEMLQSRMRGLGSRVAELIILPIYASLPTELQSKIFEPTPPGSRKVVLATNIAETSITIDNIVYVVDPGYCKQNAYSPQTGTDTLKVVPISQASADQRAGRAGRVKPGKCFRLFTKWSFSHELEPQNAPEILRSNLASVVLLLKSIGIDNVLDFEFMDRPPAQTLQRAIAQLYVLGALNDRGELTVMGRRMSALPLDPPTAKCLLASEKFGCVDEIVVIVAMLSVGNAVFFRPKEKEKQADQARKGFASPAGDPLTLLRVFRDWEAAGGSAAWCKENFIQLRTMRRARDIKEQIERLLISVDLRPSSDSHNIDNIRKALASGFFENCARLGKGGNYVTVKNPHQVDIHPHSCLFKQGCRVVIYHELMQTTKEYMREVFEVKPEWLMEVAGDYFKSDDFGTSRGKQLANPS